MGANLSSKGQRSRSQGKCKNRFSRIASSKVDRFTSNQDQNWSSAHCTCIVEYISPANMLRFVIISQRSPCHAPNYLFKNAKQKSTDFGWRVRSCCHIRCGRFETVRWPDVQRTSTANWTDEGRSGSGVEPSQ